MLCAEDQGCTSASTHPGDNGAPSTGYGNADPHSVVLSVGWHGYTVCKVPAMEILVEAEGCEPTAITTERAVEGKAQRDFFVTLECG